MGITGLLPFLKSIQRDVHLSSLKGKKAGVDSYSWLHKGAYSCALQLVMETEQLETLPFIKYCIKKVNLLRQYDITPVMVFDGGPLPIKAHTEEDRRGRRKSYLDKGKQLLKDGRRSDAVDCFQKCVDVSPAMALALIKECRKIGVECVVAPYEADAQLTYLQKEGLVDLVITEDSDLLVFGCERVLFKLDDSGRGKLIELKELGKANKGLVGFTQDSFRQMCIFSGCDYLPSVPGIGLGKSLKFMKRCHQNPTQVICMLQCETGKVPQNYAENFQKAEASFLHQLVFDPRTQTQVRLHPLPDDKNSQDFEFAGMENSPRKAVGIARGNIDPITMRVLDFYSPSKAPPPKTTSWSESAHSSSSKYPVPIQAKLPLERTRPPPQANKRRRLEEDEAENSLDQQTAEKNLCSLYGVSQTSEESVAVTSKAMLSSQDEPVTSRYFSSEATPSGDLDHPSRKALSDKQTTEQLLVPVRRKLLSADSPQECVVKTHSIFGFPSKKPKTFGLLDEQSTPPSISITKNTTSNPFAKFKFSSTPRTTKSSVKTESIEEKPKQPFFMTPPTSHPTTPSTQPRSSTTVNNGLSVRTNKLSSRVGLSKTRRSNSFKAPRPSAGQSDLRSFVYLKKPQLKH